MLSTFILMLYALRIPLTKSLGWSVFHRRIRVGSALSTLLLVLLSAQVPLYSCEAGRFETFGELHELYRALRSQGLQACSEVRLDEEGFLSTSEILEDLASPEVKSALVSPTNQSFAPRQYKIFVATNETALTGCKILVAMRPNGLGDDDMAAFCSRLHSYCHNRIDGHSRKYSVAALQETFGRYATNNSSENSSFAEYVRNRARIPLGWLQKSTNDESYFVHDGALIWVYNPRSLSSMKRDARELDPKYKAALDTVISEVKSNTFAPSAFRETKRLMKLRYGLEWMSPMELNPGIQF